MPIATSAELLDSLRRARLLEQHQLAELPALQARFPEPRALGDELVRRGWLTTYQANALLRGDGHDLLLGSYVLLEKLGEGGMGAVFKARNWKLGRVVALKLIRKERLASETIVRRFHREIRAAAQLAHPNVVRAYDADEVRGTHFFAMECVEGEDLARLVKRGGPLPAAQACEYVRQAALGLQHAFERGLVHRDIKPHNLLLTTDGTVKVLDLGLARLGQGPEADAASSMTETGCMVGTPDYMAPEQARDSHTADIRSDLYSLGCTLYYLLAGRVPFPGGTVTEKMLRHNMDEPTPLEQLRPDVPPDVPAVVRLLMAKRPEDRYQTPAELVKALAPLAAPAGGAPPAAGSEVTADTAWSDVATAGEAGPDPAYARRRAAERRRWLLLNLTGAAVFVGLVGLVLGLVWLLRAPPPAPRPVPIPAAERGGSPLDKLDPGSIPAAERFDRQPPELVAVLGEHRGRHWGSATTVAVSRDGKQVATGGADGLIRFWDPLTGREQRTIRAVSSGWIYSLALSPDARRLACYVGGIGFYDLSGPEPVREKTQLRCQGRVLRLLFTPDGKRLVGLDQGNTLSVWDLTASAPKLGMQQKSYPGARPSSGFDLSADGSTLTYFPNDKAVRLLDISGPDARELATLPLPEPGLTLALAPDGKRLAVGFRGGKVRLWDVTGKAPVPRGVIDSGHAPVVMRFSPDGKRLAAAYTSVRLWDVGGAEPVGGESFAPSLLSTECADLAFTPDGRTLVSAGSDSTVRFWDVSGDRPQERNPLDPASYVSDAGPARGGLQPGGQARGDLPPGLPHPLVGP
jgi:WD40 repeat protein